MRLFCLVSAVVQLAAAQFCQRDFAVPSNSDPSDVTDGDAVIVSNAVVRGKRTAISNKNLLWPNGVIHYTIDPSYSESQKADILTAMYHWENGTCIRFYENDNGGHNHINIFPGEGCTSYVGNVGCGRPQGVSVNPASRCYSVASIIHELGHVLGLHHEQRRPDRDDYVDILYENIDEGFRRSYQKFQDHEVDTLDVGYDYNSIMHYTYNVAAHDGNIVVGRAIVPSSLDIIKVNRLYNCDIDNLPPMNIALPPAPAPPTLSLPFPGCGKIFDGVKSTTFTSLNYPAYPHDYECGWVIRVEPGYRMKIRLDLSIEASSGCRDDYLVLYSNTGCSRPSRIMGKLCGRRRMTYRGNVGETEACLVFRTDSKNVRHSFKGIKIKMDTEDINECETQSDACNHRCINTAGSYRCECDNGYFLSADKRTCFDTNECALDNGGCSQHCHNYGGGYECSCGEDYRLDSDGHHCVLVSSTGNCSIDNGGCQQVCEWTPDGAICKCDTGYQFNENDIICEDIDECQVCTGCDSVCGDHALCYNTLGSYDCECRNGYQLNGTTCQPLHGGCINVDCGMGGVCVPVVGGAYYCECSDGYVTDASTGACIDFDECSSGSGVCGAEECFNTPGSYLCYCNEAGYQFNETTRTCDDVNECEEDRNVCGEDFTCTNTVGSYNCSCKRGLQYDPATHTCQDINECDDTSLNCLACFNTIGSYYCFCDNIRFRTNYPLFDRCIDINECTESYTGCHHHCANTVGSYYCYCSEGYHLMPDGKSCVRD